jgi:hypothetical protein
LEGCIVVLYVGIRALLLHSIEVEVVHCSILPVEFVPSVTKESYELRPVVADLLNGKWQRLPLGGGLLEEILVSRCRPGGVVFLLSRARSLRIWLSGAHSTISLSSPLAYDLAHGSPAANRIKREFLTLERTDCALPPLTGLCESLLHQIN